MSALMLTSLRVINLKAWKSIGEIRPAIKQYGSSYRQLADNGKLAHHLQIELLGHAFFPK